MKFEIQKYLAPYLELIFPNVCVCCEAPLIDGSKEMICDFCKKERFEAAGGEQVEFLPETVDFVFTMWNFDKGGYLQDLLHKLKYDHLKSIGEELGRSAAIRLKYTPHFKKIEESTGQPLIIPVPLHFKKERKRGYNQARAISVGVAQVTGWELAEKGTVIRVSNTKTQTGLNYEQRRKNLKSAFKLEKPELVSNRLAIIVDDVFTTGATTFELVQLIQQTSSFKAGIITIARS